MKKVRVTETAIKEAYDLIVPVGYCALQFLLRFEQAMYYTAGRYGWKSDIYVIRVDYIDVVISTGFQPFGNLNGVTYSMLSDYDSKAQKILLNRDYTMTMQKEMIDKLLDDMCREFIEMQNEQAFS